MKQFIQVKSKVYLLWLLLLLVKDVFKFSKPRQFFLFYLSVNFEFLARSGADEFQ